MTFGTTLVLVNKRQSMVSCTFSVHNFAVIHMSVTKFITRYFGCNLLTGVSLPYASFAWNITEPYAAALQ